MPSGMRILVAHTVEALAGLKVLLVGLTERIALDLLVTLEHDDLGTGTLLLAELFKEVTDLAVERVGIAVGHSLVQKLSVFILDSPEELRIDCRGITKSVDETRVSGDFLVKILGKLLDGVLDEVSSVSRNGCGVVHIVQWEEVGTEKTVERVTEDLVDLLHHIVDCRHLMVARLLGGLHLVLEACTAIEEQAGNLRNYTFLILTEIHLVTAIVVPRALDEVLPLLLGKHIVNRLGDLDFRRSIEGHHN